MAASAKKPSIIVLISGNGSNLQALIDASASGALPAEISLVVSNRSTAYGLTRAANAGIETLVFPLKPYKDAGKTREQYDVDLADRIASQRPDLVVLAGWMHILSDSFIQKLPDIVINLHPALPGEFDGAHAIERAFEAFQKGEIKRTGVMVHRVIAEVDRGEVVLKREVPILDSDTLETLEERIHSVEHQIIVEGAVERLKELGKLEA
ncbi:formyl transferase [Hyaloraphidium curvatum]|nr:formyl transferase [Hyaloraphidium curvatum]